MLLELAYDHRQQATNQTYSDLRSLRRQTELLYRGSRDGFEAETFHFLCDNQGPTLTLIERVFDANGDGDIDEDDEKHSRIFGGFTDIAWQATDEVTFKQGSGNSFLFYMDPETRRFIKLKCLDKDTEVAHKADSLVIFG